MIEAEFFHENGAFTGFAVSGHAGFDQHGRDIVCASVSSAVQLTVNGITEILSERADIKVKENLVKLLLKDGPSRETNAFFKALKLHLELLCEDYPGTIHISCMEV